jgi:capsule polysaccharide export protein KpsE/RkpR
MSETTHVSAADGQGAGRIIKKVRKGRLPNYYTDVVTEKQREDIYKIQEEYKPKIDALKTQLDALNKEMNDKISALLTAEQKKKVEDAAAAAAKAKSAKEEKPAEQAKPADKAEKKAEK